MKYQAIIICLGFLSGCQAEPPAVDYYDILLLSDKQFMIGTKVADIETNLFNVMPDKTKQVNISTCPFNIKIDRIISIVDSLNANGYDRIAFTADSLKATRELCANYALKGTSV